MSTMTMMPYVPPSMLASRPAPQGWVGSWPPAPPPFARPPPPPPGFDSNAWYSGQWQFNPAWRGPVQQAQMWAPHPSWGVQQQQQYIVGPSGRLIKQPNRDYWETQLVDNPLGLENMHIRYAHLSSL